MSRKRKQHGKDAQAHEHEEEKLQEAVSKQESGSSESEEETQSDQVAELEAKLKELEEQRLRDLAEYDNIKKRLEREKQQAIAYAIEQFARDLLAVTDSLDNAQASVQDVEDPESALSQIREGINLTLEQFKKVFAKHGIELVDMESGFDPHFHEAVMQVESEEHEPGEIVQVLQKGYKIKDRVLRPAMVSVAK